LLAGWLVFWGAGGEHAIDNHGRCLLLVTCWARDLLAAAVGLLHECTRKRLPCCQVISTRDFCMSDQRPCLTREGPARVNTAYEC
jgi:hypothetical protein